MKVLVTGAAGFVGNHVALRLLERGDQVIGLDNLNPYYSVELKKARLGRLLAHSGYTDIRGNIEDKACVDKLFHDHKPDRVVNLAAQAGVRHSLLHPQDYIDSNITGFLNILEACRHFGIAHLVFASSSSVYGANAKMPFSTHDRVDHPLSLYAATKRANELMAHSYSHLFQFPSTGLRFFSVYGPWGRPDMALYKFADAIVAGQPIDIYNHGKMQRDFTYIDDIAAGTVAVLDSVPGVDPTWNPQNTDPASSGVAPFCIHNIGHNKPVELIHYIKLLEESLGLKAIHNMLPMQPGDVTASWADIDDLDRAVGYVPATPVDVGVSRFVEWYLGYRGMTRG